METTDNPAGTGEAKGATPAAGPETPAARGRRGRFQKGAPSANPKGRPTESREMKELARDRSKEAIARLVYWMRSGDPTASIAAAKELLNRGYGRPEQSVTLDAEIALANQRHDPVVVHDANVAAEAYFDIIQGRRSIGSVTFMSQADKEAEAVHAEMMKLAAQPVLAPPPSPALEPPKPRAEPPEPVQAPTSPEPRPAAQEYIPAERAPSSTLELWEKLGRPENPQEALSALDAALRHMRAPWVVT